MNYDKFFISLHFHYLPIFIIRRIALSIPSESFIIPKIMKNALKIFAVLLAAVSFNSGFAQSSEKSPLIHAIYSLEREWPAPEAVAAPELDAFDFVYIMAAPKWTASDFDLSQEEINEKYVNGHEYRHPEGMKAFIDAVHGQGGKILCSFPGTEFIEIAPDSARADKFAVMMAEFAAKYGYDGIEVDWEHTVTEELHLDFMKRIRRELSRKAGDDGRDWLTTALHSYRQYTPEMAAELSACVDWINIMFYDMGGGIWGTVPTHNSPLDAMDRDYRKYWPMFDPAKLHIGMPNYGFYYRGIRPGEKAEEGKTLRDYGRYCDYTELAPLMQSGWTEVWDEQAQCPYYFSADGTEFMTLESPRSLDAKLKWVEDNGFGGIFWWEYSCDWIKPAVSGTRGQHLLVDHVTSKIKK